ADEARGRPEPSRAEDEAPHTDHGEVEHDRGRDAAVQRKHHVHARRLTHILHLTVIDVRDVTRRFGSFTALSHASFVVAGGEIVALLGPNGAGKTTASRIIAGILAPTEGDAMVDGISVRDDPDRVRGRIGLVTDSPSLYERMTLRAYLVYFARL